MHARFDGAAPEPRKGIRAGHVPGSKCIPFGQVGIYKFHFFVVYYVFFLMG